MRHAIRCAVCLGIAVACERLLEIPPGAVGPMTGGMALRPDCGGALRFGLLRVAGTFGGLLLTSLVVHLVLDSVVQSLLLMALLCVAFRLLATVNYGLGVAMLTGMLVVLLAFQGIAPGEAIHMRSEEHTSELQSLMRISYAVFCLKKKKKVKKITRIYIINITQKASTNQSTVQFQDTTKK